MNKFLLPWVLLLIVTACNSGNSPDEPSDIDINGDVVTIADHSPILNKLQCQRVDTSSYCFEVVAAGVVKAIPNRYAFVAVPFPGRIVKSYIRLGQEVNEGTPLFEISSMEYFETTKAYFQAKDELQLGLKNFLRQKDLLEKGVGIQRDFEEAEVAYMLRKKDFESALAALTVFQVDTASLFLGQPLIIRSPIKGTIVEDNVVIGQFLKEDSDPIATIAELSRVWVVGQVKEKDIGTINSQNEVDIQLMAYPGLSIKGRVYHISSVIDEETRSAQIFIECDNGERLMKPGMYATSTFKNTTNSFIKVPAKAVLQMDDSSYVYVCTSKNQFTKRPIETVTECKEFVLVRKGLKPNEEIIVNGGFYLLG